jgi:hypothetical protein
MWVFIGGGISLSVVSSLAIIAFLGRFVGTFTVSLETRNVDLTLSEKSDFANRSSYLRVNNVSHFQEFTYSDFDSYGDEVIDSEATDHLLGANYVSGSNEVESLDFFKYTFYVRNVGKEPAKYDFTLNILENVASEDGRSLEDTMRVMIYTNGVKEVYAKPESTPHVGEDGKPDYRAPISIDEDKATPAYPFMGYAEPFASSEIVAQTSGLQLDIGETKRYTIVTWLEGFQSSNYQTAPKGATIKLGVEINAYEIQ